MTKLDLYNIPIDNEKTFELLGEGLTAGVFQLENKQLGARYSSHLKPKSIQEIAAIIALIRPGSLNSKMSDGKSVTEHYEMRHLGQEESTPIIKEVGDLLKNTHDLMIFQEQTLIIAKELAGFDGSMAMKLQKGISKKKAEIINELRPKFVEGCVKNGIAEKDAIYLYDIIEASNRYSFNLCQNGSQRILRFPTVNAPYTIEEMYNIRNDIRYAEKTGHSVLRRKWKSMDSYGYGFSLCEDGRIRKNIIKNIYYSGEQEVFDVILENGAKISVTANHKFPTPNGEKQLKDLSVGDELFVRGEYEKTNKKYNWSDMTREEIWANNSKGVFRHFGKANHFYTNGSYSDFVQCQKTMEKVCRNCGAKNCRIEFHHINGDRSNSKPENIEPLCVSCHKKKEYAAGRTKIGEKGYPSLTSKIVSITSGGVQRVYDVEMEGPNHNLLNSDGIVTSNSHSIGYSYISYEDAYCKANFPIEFFIATLRINDDFDYIRKIVEDCAKLGIRVKPPTLQKPCITFTEFEGQIYYGFSNIKGIGEAKAQDLVETFQTPPTSWYECLCKMTGLGKTLVQNSIKAGVFSYLKVPIRKMLDDFSNLQLLSGGEMKFVKENWANYTDFSGLFKGVLMVCQTKRRPQVQSVCDLIERPAETLEDNLDDIIKYQNELLGVPLSYDLIDTVERLGNCTIEDIKSGLYKKEYILVAEIIEMNVFQIKKGQNIGKTMAKMIVKDTTGECEMIVFSNVYSEIGGMLKSGLVHTFNCTKKENLILQSIEIKNGF